MSEWTPARKRRWQTAGIVVLVLLALLAWFAWHNFFRVVPQPQMSADERFLYGSVGAEEMFVFHQLSAGKTGSGPGGAAPSTGTVGGHCASAAAVAATVNSRANSRRFVDIVGAP